MKKKNNVIGILIVLGFLVVAVVFVLIVHNQRNREAANTPTPIIDLVATETPVPTIEPTATNTPTPCVHEFISSITKDVTCTEEGIKTFSCKYCDETYIESIIAPGHELVTDTIEATVEADGHIITYCKNCDYRREESIPMLTPTSSPVPTNTPVPTSVPTRVVIPTVVVPTASPDAFVYEKKETAKIMTYETFKTVNGETSFYTATAKWKAGDNCTLTLYEDGTLVLSGSGATYDYTVETLPWQSNGRELKLFDENVKKLVIEEGITYIGSRVFSGIDGLKSATIPKGVKALGEGAFLGCKALSEVILSNGLEVVGESCFSDCPIKEISLPESLRKIDDSAFNFCKIKELVIPKNVTYLGSNSLDQLCNTTIYVKGKSGFKDFEYVGSCTVFDNGVKKLWTGETYIHTFVFEK